MHEDLPDWITIPLLLVLIFLFIITGGLIFAFVLTYVPWLILLIPGIWLVMVLHYFYKRYKSTK